LDIERDKLSQEYQNWGDEYSIEFDIVVTILPNAQWLNVFRFTATNENYGSPGDRIPALFINKAGYFAFRTSLNNEANYAKNIDFLLGMVTLVVEFSNEGHKNQ
jgi:hypothetical protein